MHWTYIYSESYSTNDLDIAAGPALTPQISGIVGLCITSLLWIIASWRLLYHYAICGTSSKCCIRPGGEEEQRNNSSNNNNNSNNNSNNHARGLTTKRILHVLLWITMVVEGVGYADMVASNTSNKLNYTLLDIIGRGMLEYLTFGIGTFYWFNVISQARSSSSAGSGSGENMKQILFASTTIFPVILAIVTIVVMVVSIFEAVTLLAGGYDTVDDFREHSKIHRISLIVESVGWGIHAVIVAICCNMVYKRISSLPTFSQVKSNAKRNIINKMVIPMIFCSLSYALRSGFMAADFSSRIVSPETTFEAGVGWWVGNVWLPTLIPSIMLLYSIRKRDREEPGYASVGIAPTTSSSSSPLMQSDSYHAQTLGNPFEAFHQNMRDFEEEDSTHDTSLESR